MIGLKDIENNYKLKVAKFAIAKNIKEALILSKNIGYPVALKIYSPDILHKMDIGGVKLNLKNELEVKKSFNQIMQLAKSNCPNVNIEGILVQEMIHYEGFELIIGYINDNIFGPVIMIGLGGIFADVFNDVAFRVLPATKEEVESIFDELKFSKIILEGFRNIKKVSKELIIDVILKVCKMAEDNINSINSFEFNPIIFYENDYRIVDFKCTSALNDISTLDEIPKIENIDGFFNVNSVAIIGVSDNEMQIGNIILDSLIKSGFNGKIYPINPKNKEIYGIKSFSSINDIDDRIDVVIITIPLISALEILESFKEKKIKNVIIISSGGKEVGNNEIESKIKTLAKIYNIRVIGCNCLGVFDPYNKFDTLFLPHSQMKRPDKGNISLISQSGTVGIASLEFLGKYGVSKFISHGNRIDVDEGDLIDYLKKDDKTKVIAVYIEGLEKGRKFYKSAKEATDKKPVIVYKASRSKQSELAALSHTGFLSGTHKMYQDIMRQAHIHQVDNLESLVASAKVLSVYKRIKGDSVQLITNGAGAAIQAIDRISLKNILRLSKLSEETIENLKMQLQSHIVINNPIDLTGTATIKDFEIVIDNVLKDNNVDLIMIFFVFQCKPITIEIKDIIKKYMSVKPIVCGTLGGSYAHYMGEVFESEKIPIFFSIEEWVSAAEALIQWW